MSKVANFLKGRKDEIASVSAIVATIAILWGAIQVHYGRKALEAEALAVSLSSARQMAQTILARADVAARVQGISVDEAENAAFVAMVIGLYSSHYFLTQSEVLPREYWDNYRPDFCEFVQNPVVDLQLSKNIASGAYPMNFRDEILSCIPN